MTANKLAYLLNTYPTPSGTFVRNEILALEQIGPPVTRLAVRRFAGPLVDPLDLAERDATRLLIDGNLFDLCRATLRMLVTNPLGLARALPAWWGLLRNSGGGLVRHIAYLMQAAFLREEARRSGIAHVHSHFSNNAPAVAMLSFLMGGPSYSFTAHGPDEFVDAAQLSFAAKIEHAAFVVAISDYCRAMLISLADRTEHADKIHIARCGLDLDQFAVAAPVAPDNYTLVCVGRLCPQKGQVHIPAAVAALRQKFPALRVILVGDGDSRADIEREIARHDVAQHVILHGWASSDDVRKLIAASRTMLLPSYAEGLPVVIMEAFALGRPVISTPIAGIPELVDAQCGWLVTPGDHAQLVAAMEAALTASPAQLAMMGQEGRRRVERQHDRRVLAEQLQTLFALPRA
ncbi:glycosyltransferase family 4 protein [Devosia sp. A449]